MNLIASQKEGENQPKIKGNRQEIQQNSYEDFQYYILGFLYIKGGGKKGNYTGL